ncbi:larval cuticle protein LCP-17 [Manduca sexta]|uniref:larval cuticle protein LCP-17 n=1 Tax=Manduca sexta TaxID=7130 RepID=UPI00118342F1|nr:larval cuticle protein LCP-17 [Manduca sexta]
MKLLIISACVALAFADVSHLSGPEANAKIISQDLDVSPEGAYQWSFETENGIAAKASGVLNNPQSPDAAQISQGSSQWVSPEGEVVRLEYVADENGYQPQGSHIPTPPPIPPEILRALEYIRAHPPAPERK